jgi:cytochrome P450
MPPAPTTIGVVTGSTQLQPDIKDDPAIDPYPHYARMREQCPVAHVQRRSGLAPYLVTAYADAKAALADPRLSLNPETARPALEAAGFGHIFLGTGPSIGGSLLRTDPPDHTRLRRLVMAQFTPRRVAQLRPRIQAYADELVDAFAPQGRAELVGAFAEQLPALVIAELLGVPAADRERFRKWAADSLLPAGHSTGEDPMAALGAYLAEAIERRRTDPGDDLLSLLVAGEADDKLDAREVLSAAILLLIAGHETTVNLIGNGMHALLTHPDQMALLLERPELVPGAVEEFLRYDGPVERSVTRFTTEDVEIGGTTIPAGSVVNVVIGSADRDGTAYPDPDRLDVLRQPRAHLAFGHGIHFCLGASLARLEGEIAFTTLLRRLPGLALATDQVEHRPSIMMRGLAALPVTFTPSE